MKNTGYLILQKQQEVLRRYEEQIAQRNLIERYRKFRNEFSFFNSLKYLGISRNPLFGVPLEIQSEFGEILEPEAMNYLSILEQQNLCDNKLIYDYNDTINTFKKIINDQFYEMIHVRTGNFESNSNVLGFDIGYLGGDYFSLIADTIVTPTWHGPPEKDYNELLDKLKSLNENLLFESKQDAEEFKNYYLTKSWAETESVPGEFVIIQIQKMYFLI